MANLGETARLNVFGPNWKMISSIGGGIILSMISLFVFLGLAEMSDQRTNDRTQNAVIQQHSLKINTLQSDLSYIRSAVDDIRSMVRRGGTP